MEITALKKQLEAELQQVEQELQQLEEQLEEKPEFGLGKGDTGTYSWEMALARKGRAIEQMNNLREALNRVEEGSYGYCERCGNPINPERLEILPTTTLCANCARKQ